MCLWLVRPCSTVWLTNSFILQKSSLLFWNCLQIIQTSLTQTVAGQPMSGNKTGNQTANQTVGGGLKNKVGG